MSFENSDAAWHSTQLSVDILEVPGGRDATKSNTRSSFRMRESLFHPQPILMQEQAESAVKSVRETYWPTADQDIWANKALELLLYVMERMRDEVVHEVHQSQLEGAVWGWMRWYMARKSGNERMLSGGIICDETGTGKTFKTIMIGMMIWKDRAETDPDTVLVLVPTKELLDQWCTESDKFFKVSPVGIHKSWGKKTEIMVSTHTDFQRVKKRKHAEAAAPGATKYMPLFIQDIESERDEEVEAQRLLGVTMRRKEAFLAVMIDEAHKVLHTNNPEVHRFNAIRKMTATAVFLATASPPSDPQFQTQLESIRLISGRPFQLLEAYDQITTCVRRTELPAELKKIVVGVELGWAENHLLDHISNYCMSVKANKRIGVHSMMQHMYFMLGAINAPPSSLSDSLSLTKLREYLKGEGVNYKSILEESDFQCEMPSKFQDGRPNKVYIGPYLHTLIFDKNYGVQAQLSADASNKIVIFTKYQGEADLVSSLLDKVKVKVSGMMYGVINGKISTDDKQAVLARFQKASSKWRVLVLSSSIGDTGLNLQCANIVYHTTIETDPWKMIQCISRVFRQGQKRTVNWMHLCGETSTEKKAMGMHNNKLSGPMKAGSVPPDRQLLMSRQLNHKMSICL
eukprot:gene29467-5815_t